MGLVSHTGGCPQVKQREKEEPSALHVAKFLTLSASPVVRFSLVVVVAVLVYPVLRKYKV